MARYRHPRGAAVAIDLGGERVVCDDDGTFESDDKAAVRALAQAYDTTVADLRVGTDDDSAGESGETDGCPFCGEYDGANVAQHAAQAHPDQWADYDGGDE